MDQKQLFNKMYPDTNLGEDDVQEEVLDFWFGALDELGMASKAVAKRWYLFDAEFDREIDALFRPLLEEAIAGELGSWRDSPRGRLALIILLDQFSRQVWRGQAKAFAQDPLAQALVEEGLSLGHDQQLAFDERHFFYMPLMHAESRSLQELSVQHFTELASQSQGAQRQPAERSLHFAREHRDIIDRFGRFPHRNTLLGRASSPEEAHYLSHHGARYGQG